MTKRDEAKLSITPPSARKAAAAAARGGKAARDAKALQEGTARLTLDMPQAAHRALKMLATERGMSMRDFIMDALAARGLHWD